MKIAIAGGRDEADFLIGLLIIGKNKLIVMNEDKIYCEHLASVYDNISIIYGDPSKEYVMNDAQIRGFDVMIALCDKDADNLEICQMAKRLFAVKKTICTVRNPKNVEIFEILGVDRAISAAYMLAHLIEQASIVEKLVKVVPLENDQVLVNEMKVKSNCPARDKKIVELKLPEGTIISCIIRDTEVLVPNGESKIMAGDRLVVMTTPRNQQEVVKAIVGYEQEKI